jgi:hypothetical protein
VQIVACFAKQTLENLFVRYKGIILENSVVLGGYICIKQNCTEWILNKQEAPIATLGGQDCRLAK